MAGPLAEIVGEVQTAGEDRLGRARAANGVQQRLQTGDLVGARLNVVLVIGRSGAGGPAAGPVLRAGVPTVPADRVAGIAVVARPRVGWVIGLVEQVEDDRGIALERRRHRLPERWGVVAIGHRLLLEGDLVPGCRPVQIENRVDPVRVELSDVVLDLLPIAGHRQRRVGSLAAVRLPVDPQPAVLVERDPDSVRAPGCNRRRVRVVEVPVVVAEAVDAPVLRARVVDAQQPDRLAGAVDEMVAGDRRSTGAPAPHDPAHPRAESTITNATPASPGAIHRSCRPTIRANAQPLFGPGCYGKPPLPSTLPRTRTQARGAAAPAAH